MKWTTRVLKEMPQPHGLDKAHYACFLPKKWPGEGLVVSLRIPEGEMHADLPRPPGAEPAVFITTPTAKHQKLEDSLGLPCMIATRRGAALYFACNTAKQAERAAEMASKLLPNHERVALERMPERHTSARSGLQ